MSKASKETFLAELYAGNLERNGTYLLHYLMTEGRKGLHELRDELTIPHQSLTGTLSDLHDCGLVDIVDTVRIEIDGRNRSFSVYEFVNDEKRQEEIIRQRKKERAEKWLNVYKKNKSELKELLNIKIMRTDGFDYKEI